MTVINIKENKKKFFDLIFVVSFVLVSWSLISFQIDVYILTPYIWDIIKYILIFFLSYYSFLGYTKPINLEIFKIFLAHVITILIYLIFVFNFELDKLIVSCVTFLYWGLFFYLYRNQYLIIKIIKFGFLLSFALIAFNSILILHWLDFINLNYDYVSRVGGDHHLEYLDPIHFGIFGVSENDSFQKFFIDTPRLQGWSSEPLHWSYFVFMNILLCLTLINHSNNEKQKIVLYFCLLFSSCYLYFLHSSTVLLSCLAILIFFILYKFFISKIFLRKLTRAKFFYFFSIIVPGLIFPFILANLPQVELIFQNGNFLNEGSNWANKIGFVGIENLEVIFFPSSVSSDSLSSHNLILTNYISAGYFLSFPLLLFFYLIVKQSVLNINNIWPLCIFITMISLVIDSSLIYPTTVFLILVILFPLFNKNYNQD